MVHTSHFTKNCKSTLQNAQRASDNTSASMCIGITTRHASATHFL